MKPGIISEWDYEECIEDKGLRERLLREREESYYPEKWVRSIDVYRALDDAVMEG